MGKRYAKIIERNGKQHLAFAVGGKDEAWYEQRGFLEYGGIEPVRLHGRKTIATVPVVIDGKVIRARIYDNMSPHDYDTVMEDYIREVRCARGYTTREPDDYFGSSNPRWAQDAKDWVAFRDAVMTYALDVINTYTATGNAPTLAEFIAGFPKIVWTYQEEV